jgi:hypothetical protein
VQISSIHATRAARSSVAAFTLMSSCAFNARSTSATTSSVRPLSPIITVGFKACACDRSSLRRAGVRGVGMARLSDKRMARARRGNVTCVTAAL